MHKRILLKSDRRHPWTELWDRRPGRRWPGRQLEATTLLQTCLFIVTRFCETIFYADIPSLLNPCPLNAAAPRILALKRAESAARRYVDYSFFWTSAAAANED